MNLIDLFLLASSLWIIAMGVWMLWALTRILKCRG